MEQTLLTAGIGCIVAAIVGGGLEAFGLKIPLLNTTSRKVLLACLGVVLMALPTIPLFSKTAVVSGKVFDVVSNQGISGVRLTLIDLKGKVLEEDIFTTAQDGGFQFSLPRGINKNQLPLHFQLNRSRWAANYVPEERVTDLSSDRQINLPIDLASLNRVWTNSTSNSVVSSGPKTAAPSSSIRNNHSNPLATAPPTVLNSEELTLLKTGTITLLARQLTDFIDFEVHVRPPESPSLNFDVNKNNVIDQNIDVSYGLTNLDGPCTQYFLTFDARTPCGGFQSESRVEIRRGIEAGVPIKIVIWHIPKREINAGNGDAHLTVQVFNQATQGWSYFPSQDFTQILRTL